jgi:hypothetical protein
MKVYQVPVGANNPFAQTRMRLHRPACCMLAGTMARNAPGKGKGPKSDWGGWGSKQAYQNAIMSGQVKTQVMAGGNLKGLLGRAATTLATPVRNLVSKIGDDAAASVLRGKGAAPNVSGKIVRVSKKADVYTPQGVFKGADVFVKKPALTQNQIQGLIKAADTRQAREFGRLAASGRKAAGVGLGVGAAGGAGAVVGGQKLVKKARGGGTKKR